MAVQRRHPPARGGEGDDRWARLVSETERRGGGGGLRNWAVALGHLLGQKEGARGNERGTGPAGQWAGWPGSLSPFSFFLFFQYIFKINFCLNLNSI